LVDSAETRFPFWYSSAAWRGPPRLQPRAEVSHPALQHHRPEKRVETDEETTTRAVIAAIRDRETAAGDTVPVLLAAAQALATRGKRNAAYRIYCDVLEIDRMHPEALMWAEEFLRSNRDYSGLRALLLATAGAADLWSDVYKQRFREVAGLCEGRLRDDEGAISALRRVLCVDPDDEGARRSLGRLLERTSRWMELVDLEGSRGNLVAAAKACERALQFVRGYERAQLARRLARLYEQLDDSMRAACAFEMAYEADPEDFDALVRLCDLYEKAEQWERLAELLPRRIEVEVDESEASALTGKLATVLADKLHRPSDALAVLAESADQGDTNLRAIYIRLGDKHGLHGLVAAKELEWSHGARDSFDQALSGRPREETLDLLEREARDGDSDLGGSVLRRALCWSMAAAGQGIRDNGRTRATLLRRAASMAHRDLGDWDLAFGLLAEAIVAHVEPSTLDALEALAHAWGDASRAEAMLSGALAVVLDPPRRRQLHARRAKIRLEQLGDREGAAADLRQVYDLTSDDRATMDTLCPLLRTLGGYRELVQLLEEELPRCKDLGARIDLARWIARTAEDHLPDPCRAADAWLRVLRMNHGDTEATAGLERARSALVFRGGFVTAHLEPPTL
jgi:tetratricopeptide (TPR) repeat protein